MWLTMSGHHGPVCACTAQSLGMMCGKDAAMVMAAGGLLVLHCYHPAYPVLRAVLACSQAPCNSWPYAALSSIFPLPFPIFFPPQPICPPWVENQNQTRITIPNPSPPPHMLSPFPPMSHMATAASSSHGPCGPWDRTAATAMPPCTASTNQDLNCLEERGFEWDSSSNCSRAPSPSWSIASSRSDDSTDAEVHTQVPDTLHQDPGREVQCLQAVVPEELASPGTGSGGRRNRPAVQVWGQPAAASGCGSPRDDAPTPCSHRMPRHMSEVAGGALLPSYRTSVWCTHASSGSSGWDSQVQGHNRPQHVSSLRPTAQPFVPWSPAVPVEPDGPAQAWAWVDPASMYSQRQAWGPAAMWLGPGGGCQWGGGVCCACNCNPHPPPPPPPPPTRCSLQRPKLCASAREVQPGVGAMEASILRMCGLGLDLGSGDDGQGNLKCKENLQLPPLPPLFYVGTRTVVTLLPRQWCLGMWRHPCASFASAAGRPAASRLIIVRPRGQEEGLAGRPSVQSRPWSGRR